MGNQPLQPTFANKRDQWIEALLGDDPNSILNQTATMTWNAACFRVINEARRQAPRNHNGEVRIDRLTHGLLDYCFFGSHMMAIRRLTDASYSLEDQDPKGVYSLTALLKDMECHRVLFTRKVMFDAEGLEYDYDRIRQKFESYHSQHNKHSGWIPANMNWLPSQERHNQIDRLCGVCPDTRNPDDTIRKEHFCKLEQKVAEARNDVCTHVNKFIAHAATPHSRELVNADEVGITLGHLWDAHRSICEVASFLAIVVLGTSCPGFLATPQYDQFRYIDEPLIGASLKPCLRDYWQQFKCESDSWSQYTLDDYEQEFST